MMTRFASLKKIAKEFFWPPLNSPWCGYHYTQLELGDENNKYTIWMATTEKGKISKGDFTKIAKLAALPDNVIDEDELYSNGDPDQNTLSIIAIGLYKLVFDANIEDYTRRYTNSFGHLDKKKMD